MSCNFKNIEPNINCNCNSPLCRLNDCVLDTTKYLQSLNLYKANLPDQNPREFQLILLRAGLDPDVEIFQSLLICSSHRNYLGNFYPDN
jgi:hypothetical protein